MPKLIVERAVSALIRLLAVFTTEWDHRRVSKPLPRKTTLERTARPQDEPDFSLIACATQTPAGSILTNYQ
jgi:hypothetical protein